MVLMEAVKRGPVQAVCALLQYGADESLQTSTGESFNGCAGPSKRGPGQRRFIGAGTSEVAPRQPGTQRNPAHS